MCFYPVDGKAVSGFGSGNPMFPSQLTVNTYEEDNTENSSTMSGIFDGIFRGTAEVEIKIRNKDNI